MKPEAKELVGINVPYWFCLIYKDGAMVGNEQGVTCYKTVELAQAANTIANARMGCTHGDFTIGVFVPTEKLHKVGSHDFRVTQEEAMSRINQRRNN